MRKKREVVMKSAAFSALIMCYADLITEFSSALPEDTKHEHYESLNAKIKAAEAEQWKVNEPLFKGINEIAELKADNWAKNQCKLMSDNTYAAFETFAEMICDEYPQEICDDFERKFIESKAAKDEAYAKRLEDLKKRTQSEVDEMSAEFHGDTKDEPLKKSKSAAQDAEQPSKNEL